MSLARSIVVIAMNGFLAACQTTSPDLEKFRALGGHEQLAFARALPLEERLDLYHDLYSVKGHPRNSSLSIVFDDSGQAGFDAVMRRVTSRNTFHEYVWVLKALDRDVSLDLCEPSHMDFIRDRARMVGLQARDITYITFRRCALGQGNGS